MFKLPNKLEYCGLVITSNSNKKEELIKLKYFFNFSLTVNNDSTIKLDLKFK